MQLIHTPNRPLGAGEVCAEENVCADGQETLMIGRFSGRTRSACVVLIAVCRRERAEICYISALDRRPRAPTKIAFYCCFGHCNENTGHHMFALCGTILLSSK